MIRLTVLYNLPPGTDEAEFLRWRLGDHQRTNASAEGVLRTDFARIDGVHPPGAPQPYRFMTISEWPDRETFERAFYAPDKLEALQRNLSLLQDPLFLISEVLVSTETAQD